MIEKYLVNGNEMILLGFGLDDNQRGEEYPFGQC